MARVCAVNSIDDEINVHKAVITELEQQIKERRAAIRVLASKKNTLLPIGTLPNEVLSAIFSWLIAIDPEDSACSPSVLAEEIIVASHVSQRWRGVALGNPTLWTQISTLKTSARWLNLILERSSSSDLSVKISDGINIACDSNEKRNLEQICRDHGERITHLWLDTGICYEALPVPISAPRLRSLRLLSSNLDDWLDPVVDLSMVQALPSHCLLDTNMLHELHLSYISIAWDSHLLTNLTCLKLCGIPYNARPTPNQLYDVLTKLTELVDLELNDALPTNDNVANAYFPRMHFHGLTRLVVTSDLSEVQAFLRSVTISTYSSVSITANTSTPSTREFEELISDATACYIRPISYIKFRSFGIQRNGIGERKSVRVNVDMVPIADGDFWTLASPFHWSLSYVGDENNTLDDNLLLSSLWDSNTFDLRQVTHIHLQGFSNITSNTLQRTVGTLLEASYINLSEDAMRNSAEMNGSLTRTFLPLLSNSASFELGSANILTFLPKLTTIRLCRVRFRSTCKPTDARYDIDVKELRNCLVKRATYAPLTRRIIIHNCHGVEEADVEFLRENIENVEWDGRDEEKFLASLYKLLKSKSVDEDEDENSWEESIHDSASIW